MAQQFTLDYDVVDRLTLLNLKDYRKTIKKRVKDHLKKGTYIHPEDLAINQKLLPALDLLIDHFGG